jgi:hypothetical protein
MDVAALAQKGWLMYRAAAAVVTLRSRPTRPGTVAETRLRSLFDSRVETSQGGVRDACSMKSGGRLAPRREEQPSILSVAGLSAPAPLRFEFLGNGCDRTCSAGGPHIERSGPCPRPSARGVEIHLSEHRARSVAQGRPTSEAVTAVTPPAVSPARGSCGANHTGNAR